MKLGYNTNGLAHHAPFSALQLLTDTGYQSVAITIDHHFLNPASANNGVEIMQVKDFLALHSVHSVIETGARFLFDPNVKHAPTLLDPNPAQVKRRVDYIKYCIDLAVEFGSDCVSIWSGTKPPNMPYAEALEVLVKNLEPIMEYASQRNVVIGFEPEPGMLIDTTGRYERLQHLVDCPQFQMTMDIGHLFCLSEVPIAGFIEKWQHDIVNIHIEDMNAGVHDHLMFGEGQIYFPPVIEALAAANYTGGVHVELSRHSHDAANAVRKSYDFLRPIIDDAIVDR